MRLSVQNLGMTSVLTQSTASVLPGPVIPVLIFTVLLHVYSAPRTLATQLLYKHARYIITFSLAAPWPGKLFTQTSARRMASLPSGLY